MSTRVVAAAGAGRNSRRTGGAWEGEGRCGAGPWNPRGPRAARCVCFCAHAANGGPRGVPNPWPLCDSPTRAAPTGVPRIGPAQLDWREHRAPNQSNRVEGGR